MGKRVRGPTLSRVSDALYGSSLSLRPRTRCLTSLTSNAPPHSSRCTQPRIARHDPYVSCLPTTGHALGSASTAIPGSSIRVSARPGVKAGAAPSHRDRPCSHETPTARVGGLPLPAVRAVDKAYPRCPAGTSEQSRPSNVGTLRRGMSEDTVARGSNRGRAESTIAQSTREPHDGPGSERAFGFTPNDVEACRGCRSPRVVGAGDPVAEHAEGVCPGGRVRPASTGRLRQRPHLPRRWVRTPQLRRRRRRCFVPPGADPNGSERLWVGRERHGEQRSRLGDLRRRGMSDRIAVCLIGQRVLERTGFPGWGSGWSGKLDGFDVSGNCVTATGRQT